MANITLDDVTIELMQANVSLEKIDDNTVLANEFLNLSIDTFKQGFGDLLEFFKGNSLANLEREREQAEFNKDMLAALQDLKPEYTGPNKAPEPKDADFGLGGLLAGLAIAIGAVIGVIRGQLAAIKTFIKALTPNVLIEKIRKAITSFVAGLSMGFDLLKASLMERLNRVGRFLTGVFDDVIKFFAGESRLFSGLKNVFTTLFQPFKDIFSGLKNVLTTLFQPFKELFGMVKGLLAGPFGMAADLFSGIGKTLSSFGAMVGKVAGIVGKIFLPLTIIMTVWDTVKGAIAGFEEDGIIGGIAGAIKGFFNSLIFGPIDMLKDATAWVLGFFGFDKAKEFINSFSFEKTFTKVIDAIFSPVDTLKKLLDGVVSFFTDIGNKLTGFINDFEIPGFSVLGKEFGPWKPFADDKKITPGGSSSPSAPITSGLSDAQAADARSKFAETDPRRLDRPTTQAATAPTSGGTAGMGAVPTQSSMRIAGEQVVPGAPLTQNQMSVSAPSAVNGTAMQSGQQLQTAAQENGLLNAAPARNAGGGAGGGNVNQSNSTTVVNNSTVVVKPIPSATRRPNNSEDIFFRGAAAGYAAA